MGQAARLILVRHGETEGQSSIRYYGRTDLALSELGRAQMRAVAAALAGMSFARVFASPLRRAHEAARLIAGEQTAIVSIAEFIEVDFGLFEGLTADEIRQKYPAEFERWSRDRLAPDFTYPRGESRAALVARVERGMARMLAQWAPERAGGTALLVAHRGVIRAIARSLAEVEPDIALGSISIWELDGRWRTHALDVTAHLEGLEDPDRGRK